MMVPLSASIAHGQWYVESYLNIHFLDYDMLDLEFACCVAWWRAAIDENDDDTGAIDDDDDDDDDGDDDLFCSVTWHDACMMY